MPEGPLGGPRPAAMTVLQINVYFERSITQRPQEVVDLTRQAVEGMEDPPVLVDEITGVHGVQDNVVSIDIRGNQTTLTILNEIKTSVDSLTTASDVATGSVEEVEIIGV